MQLWDGIFSIHEWREGGVCEVIRGGYSVGKWRFVVVVDRTVGGRCGG